AELEVVGDRACARWATCASGGEPLLAANCTSYTLMTATANADNWTPVGAATSGLSNGGIATAAMLALTSTRGHLLSPDGALYSGPIDRPRQKAVHGPGQPGPVPDDGGPLPAHPL